MRVIRYTRDSSKPEIVPLAAGLGDWWRRFRGRDVVSRVLGQNAATRLSEDAYNLFMTNFKGTGLEPKQIAYYANQLAEIVFRAAQRAIANNPQAEQLDEDTLKKTLWRGTSTVLNKAIPSLKEQFVAQWKEAQSLAETPAETPAEEHAAESTTPAKAEETTVPPQPQPTREGMRAQQERSRVVKLVRDSATNPSAVWQQVSEAVASSLPANAGDIFQQHVGVPFIAQNPDHKATAYELINPAGLSKIVEQILMQQAQAARTGQIMEPQLTEVGERPETQASHRPTIIRIAQNISIDEVMNSVLNGMEDEIEQDLYDNFAMATRGMIPPTPAEPVTTETSAADNEPADAAEDAVDVAEDAAQEAANDVAKATSPEEVQQASVQIAEALQLAATAIQEYQQEETARRQEADQTLQAAMQVWQTARTQFDTAKGFWPSNPEKAKIALQLIADILLRSFEVQGGVFQTLEDADLEEAFRTEQPENLEAAMSRNQIQSGSRALKTAVTELMKQRKRPRLMIRS